VDFFTGATFEGPATITIPVPLSRMPVFVRAGGIVPEQPASGGASPLVLEVASGEPGTFDLYGDSGSGLGYTKGQYSETEISDSWASQDNAASRVSVAPAVGHYPGQPSDSSYQIEMIDVTEPSQVTLDGNDLDREPSPSNRRGWSYDAATDTLVVVTGSTPTSSSTTVVASGARPVTRSEPPTANS
jgi:hypothetical protein